MLSNSEREDFPELYDAWRKEVIAQDKGRCKFPNCQNRAKEVHHIHKWSKYPSLRFAVSNGVTLCQKHHRLIYGHEEEYIGYFLNLKNKKNQILNLTSIINKFKMEKQKITIFRDTAEKENHGWIFQENDYISTTEDFNLFTGDYTIKGYEKEFIIERKASTAEFAKNIFEARFEDELQRMEEFRWPFLILEFNYQEILDFPVNSGIPKKIWHKLRVNSAKIQSKIHEYETRFKTKIVFAGNNGKEYAEKLFKKIVMYGKNS